MKIKLSEAFVDILKRHGTEYVYGIPGATEIWFVDALEKECGIQYILGLNELTCVSMARDMQEQRKSLRF